MPAPPSIPAIRRIAPQEHTCRQAWIEALTQLLDGRPVHTIKAEHGRSVIAASMLGRRVVAKVWVHAGLLDRLRAALGLGQADRHWRGAQALDRAGVPTAPPLVLAAASGRTILVMELLDGRSVLDVLTDPLSVAVERALAAAVARGIASLHAHRLFNRDHKPSNLIVTRLDAHAGEVAVIDCVGIRQFPRHDPQRPLVRMLASLLIEPIGCRVPLRRALRRRMLRALLVAQWSHETPGEDHAGDPEFWRWERSSARALWRLVADHVAAHGDPRPAVDPLGMSHASAGRP